MSPNDANPYKRVHLNQYIARYVIKSQVLLFMGHKTTHVESIETWTSLLLNRVIFSRGADITPIIVPFNARLVNSATHGTD